MDCAESVPVFVSSVWYFVFCSEFWNFVLGRQTSDLIFVWFFVLPCFVGGGAALDVLVLFLLNFVAGVYLISKLKEEEERNGVSEIVSVLESLIDEEKEDERMIAGAEKVANTATTAAAAAVSVVHEILETMRALV